MLFCSKEGEMKKEMDWPKMKKAEPKKGDMKKDKKKDDKMKMVKKK